MSEQDSIKIALESLASIAPFVLVTDSKGVIRWASRPVIRRVERAIGMNATELIERDFGPGRSFEELALSQEGQLHKWRLIVPAGTGTASCGDSSQRRKVPLIGRWFRVLEEGQVGHADAGRSFEFVLLAAADPKTTEGLTAFLLDDFVEYDHLTHCLAAKVEFERSLKDAVAAAAALQKKNREIEEANQQLELAKTALEEQERELKRSNQELEQFAYIASHDLQEPLRMIGSFTQLLARRYQGRLDREADEFIGFVVDGVMRMQRLINDLLQYSRVNTRGKEPVPVESEEVLARSLADLKLALEESRAEVTHEPLPVVMADERQLEQLFQNLIGNAVKFHGDEPPRVHIRAERSNGEWMFSVRDNGIGIEPEHQERIFQIFQRLHTSREYPGTGIGLAVCRKIVERHGGRIWVESEPGRGADFRFTLPAAKEEG